MYRGGKEKQTSETNTCERQNISNYESVRRGRHGRRTYEELHTDAYLLYHGQFLDLVNDDQKQGEDGW